MQAGFAMLEIGSVQDKNIRCGGCAFAVCFGPLTMRRAFVQDDSVEEYGMHVCARVCARVCVCLRALALFRVSLWMLCSRTSHWVSSGSGSLASRSSMRARPETGMAGSLAGHRAGSFPVQLTCLYHSGPAGVVLAVAGRSRDVLCVRPQVYVRVPAHVLHHNNDHHQRCCRFEVRNQGGGISLPLASPPYAAESSESRLKHTSRLDL